MLLRSLTVALLVYAAATAQTTGTGTLVDPLTDNSGAVVAGAKVTVVNIETSFVSQTVKSAEGSGPAVHRGLRQ